MSKHSATPELEQWMRARPDGRRATVLVTAAAEPDRRRLMAFDHGGAGQPIVVETDGQDLAELLARLSGHAAVVINLIGYGVGPLPPPIPPPGPIGDDVLVASALQIVSSATHLARLIELRMQHDAALGADSH